MELGTLMLVALAGIPPTTTEPCLSPRSQALAWERGESEPLRRRAHRSSQSAEGRPKKDRWLAGERLQLKIGGGILTSRQVDVDSSTVASKDCPSFPS